MHRPILTVLDHMSKKLPPLNWLRSFEASARLLNFTHAADELHMTQAAISKHVKNLEFSLGVSLFNRLPSGLELNEAGAAYFPAVRKAIENLAAATDELFDVGQSYSVVVHASLIFFSTWLAPRLSDFYAQHPEVKLRFTSSIWVNGNELTDDLGLEIRYGRSGNWPNLTTDRLTWDTLVPVCSPLLLESGPCLSTPADLPNHTLLHVAGYEQGWNYWLKHHGCADLRAKQDIQFDTLIAAFEVAAQGFGVALGRSSLAAQLIKDGRLIVPMVNHIETDEAFHLVSARKPPEQSGAGLFRQWIISQARSSRNNNT